MMNSIGTAGAHGKAVDSGEDWGDEAPAAASKPWSREEAEAWRKSNPSSSPWRVVAAQAVVGLGCAAVAWAFTRQGVTAWSALYGAAAVVLPSALLARGMTKRARNPMAMAAGFMFWEMLKIGVAIAMLAIAVRVVPNLSWPALLVTMVVCIKVNWVALLWRGRRADNKA
ncbi:ATP synthase subunit I [Rhizobacter sp. Root404]|jgi:ATP synthase protein I|uniref:ATP synthase subunit I n=1 Tax=Rhizobacter sp. Root404 TaxID=1736528 RepID=UPI001F2409EE|nr:ATP synthase subunit I [Rhizobacter sp. Root404]